MKTFIRSKVPASIWEDCYPLGNGTIGVMEEGKPEGTNTIYLNDAYLWTGYGKDKHRYAASDFKRIRELVKVGKISNAEKLIPKKMLAERTESYLPLGKIIIETDNGKISNYTRNLDMNNSLFSVNYLKDGTLVKETSFVSYPDKVYVKRIVCAKPQGCEIRLTSPLHHSVYRQERGILKIEGLAPQVSNPIGLDRYSYSEEKYKKTIRFCACIQVETDGILSYSPATGFKVKAFKTLTIYYSSETSNAIGSREIGNVTYGNIYNAIAKGYDCLMERHIADYKSLFDKSGIEINDIESSPEDTVAAINETDRTGRAPDALILTLFDFGKYLTISSSRGDGNAANLQGIWNKSLTPPWSSNYTININTEMNYWFQDALGLGECLNPLYNLVEKIAKNGKAVARDTFGMGGFVCGHNSDIWGQAAMVGKDNPNGVTWGFNVSCSGWLAYHFYEHYLFTRDEYFLKTRALPIMRDALEFYLDYLDFDENWNLVADPGTSPENRFWISKKQHSVSISATCDLTIIHSLCKAYIECMDDIGDKDRTYERASYKMKWIRPYRVNANGSLQEWADDYKEVEPTHRHLSHLIGLYPMTELTPEAAPELTDAIKKALEVRTDEGTGWSIAWRALMQARLKDGDKALFILSKLLRPAKTVHKGRRGGCYSSLLGAHPPFQIDSNFGATAAIIEMLVQSYSGETKLLPALPTSWKSGKVWGIKTRNCETLEFSWTTNDGEIVIKQTPTL